ncbi:hypothetical protein [Colwellia sp. MEBiC06753]
MLLLNGTAQCQTTNKWLKAGNRHEFYMFSTNKDLYSQLDNIEDYLTKRGLDHIEIKAAEEIQDSQSIENEMLLYAFQEAAQQGISGTIVRAPVAA